MNNPGCFWHCTADKLNLYEETLCNNCRAILSYEYILKPVSDLCLICCLLDSVCERWTSWITFESVSKLFELDWDGTDLIELVTNKVSWISTSFQSVSESKPQNFRYKIDLKTSFYLVFVVLLFRFRVSSLNSLSLIILSFKWVTPW